MLEYEECKNSFLGKGGFGEVIKVKLIESGDQIVAKKNVKNTGIEDI